MNENWYWKLAQERQRELGSEISDAQLRHAAGIPDRVPVVLKLAGVLLIALPVALVAARAIGKL